VDQDVQVSVLEGGDNPGAGVIIFVVGMAGGGTRARLDQDLEAKPRQLRDCFRCGGNTALTLMPFPRYAQFQPPAPLRT
jgi:hypothetical protein